MTIAISLKVNDGVVLAADSAATLIGQTPAGPTVVQVYNNANKIFNLRKGLPIGAMSWGAGSIGQAPISTLMKDLRARFSGEVPSHKNWHLDPQTYRVSEVADFTRQFLYDELYTPNFASWPQKPAMGCLVAGFSAGNGAAEEYLIRMDENGSCTGPVPARVGHGCGAAWNGEPEAISRLLLGYSPKLAELLMVELKLDQAGIEALMGRLAPQISAQVLNDAMPIQDAIDVAEFLVDLTCKYSRYTPGAATVGGPVEVAAITQHEGFKWVKRKHYFSPNLNPELAQ